MIYIPYIFSQNIFIDREKQSFIHDFNLTLCLSHSKTCKVHRHMDKNMF